MEITNDNRTYSGDVYKFLPDILIFDESLMDEHQKNAFQKTKAVYDQVMNEIDVGGRLLNISNRTLAKLVIRAITQNYPNPIYFFDNIDEAINDFGDMVLHTVNYFIGKVHSIKHKDGKPCLFRSIEPFIIKEIIFGFYDVFHFIPEKGLPGVGMVLSKDKDHDPDCRFMHLDPIIGVFASSLLSQSYKVDNLSVPCKQDPRTVEHITSPKEESPLMKEASPFANGVYIPEVYAEMGRLLTYREAYEDYGLCFTYSFAANYLGPDNPPPIMSDGWNPKAWMVETYGTTPEKESQFWAVLLSILRPFDTGYDKAYFFQDDGIGRTGKGTTTALCRSIVGDGHFASISLKQMDGSSAHRFALEQLADLNKCLIIYDENDPKADFLEDAANFKCACTGDPIYVDRKNISAISVVFRGRIVQCINGRIGSKDNTPSLMRRIAPMMFTHKIGRGDIVENKNIKALWMKDQLVIDWFSTEAINKNILEFMEIEETTESLHEMDRQNNHVLRFIEDQVSCLTQNWFTLTDLYPAFCEFCKNEHVKPIKKLSFESEAAKILARPDSEWAFTPRSGYPDKVGTVKIGQYNVPLECLAGVIVLECVSPNGMKSTVPYEKRIENSDSHLRNDPIYDSLTYVTCDGSKGARKSDAYKAALSAITNLYHTTDTASKRAYYRKPEAEIQSLFKLGCHLIGAPYALRETLTPLDVRNALSTKKMYSDQKGIPVLVSTVVDKEEEPLWDFIAKRLSRLGV